MTTGFIFSSVIGAVALAFVAIRADLAVRVMQVLESVDQSPRPRDWEDVQLRIRVLAGAGAAMGGFLGVQLSMLLDMWAEHKRQAAQKDPQS